MLSNYRTIMIFHYLAKLYGSILELGLSVWADKNGCCSAWKGFITLDYILNFQAHIKEVEPIKRGFIVAL